MSGPALAGLPLHVAADAQALAERLARDVAAALGEAIDARGSASLVVSGGSTPAPMFRALAADASIDWRRVGVTLADERAVAADHESSNERLVRETLLTGPAAAAEFVALHEPEFEGDATTETELRAAFERVEARLATLSRPFDVVLLGMGEDGHTASLFPDAPEIDEALDTGNARRLMLMHPPSQPLTRITLTAAALLDARRVWLHVTGDAKRTALERAVSEGRLPIARALHAAGDRAALYWAA